MAQLQGRPGRHAPLPREGPGAFDAPGGVVGRPDPRGHSPSGQFAEGADRLGQWHRAVLGVCPEQIEVVDAQAAQAPLDALADGGG